MSRTFFILSIFAVLCGSTAAFAGGGIVNWYDELYRSLAGSGYDAHVAERFVTISGGVFVLLVSLVLGLLYSKSVKARLASGDVAPERSFSVTTAVELSMDLVYSIARENIGDKWRSFISLLAGVFIFIVISNLGGLIPGFIPATESFSTNLAMGATIFIVYNVAGFREHGVHYLNQFTGPMLAIAPLMITIEVVSHLFRPVSLSLRLMGNIFADHLMLGIFTSTVPHILIPSLLMFFGLLVSIVQSFVFTLLTGIYISLAVSHDH